MRDTRYALRGVGSSGPEAIRNDAFTLVELLAPLEKYKRKI
jgi:hypothetical protein